MSYSSTNKQERVAKALIDKMFKIAGHDVKYEDIIHRKDNWFWQWTMTEEQNKEWREWGKKYLKKQRFILPERTMTMFDLSYGLKIKQ
jgi:hypothetical protein